MPLHISVLTWHLTLKVLKVSSAFCRYLPIVEGMFLIKTTLPLKSESVVRNLIKKISCIFEPQG